MFKKSPRGRGSVQEEPQRQCSRRVSEAVLKKGTNLEAVFKKSPKGSVQEESQRQCSRRHQSRGTVQEGSLRQCSRRVTEAVLKKGTNLEAVFKKGPRGSVQEES